MKYNDHILHIILMFLYFYYYNFFLENEDDAGVEVVANITSSKDTCHLLRIAVVLHILTHYWVQALNQEPLSSPSLEVDVCSIDSAQIIYNAIIQQKGVFLEVFFLTYCVHFYFKLHFFLKIVLI